MDPLFFGAPDRESDEHPPANPQVGQAFVADVVQALLDSPSWPRSALFLTYDEHGGYYDHVPPPPCRRRPSTRSGRRSAPARRRSR